MQAWLMGQSRGRGQGGASKRLPLLPCLFLQCPHSQTPSAPPGAPAPAAAPSPPAATGVCPTTSIQAQTPSLRPVPAPSAPLAKQLHQDQPADSRPPSLPSSAITDRDARIPVQESVSGVRIRQGHKSPFWTAVRCGEPVIGLRVSRDPSKQPLISDLAAWSGSAGLMVLVILKSLPTKTIL